MTKISNLGLLTTLLFPATLPAQSRVATLAQALETFTAVDTNKDGKLSPEELVASKVQLSRSDTIGVDFDQDGFWSKEEFLLFYRQRLVAARVKPAADLEAEATRILAARKAKVSERKPQSGPAQPRSVPQQAQAAGTLSDAIDGLQVKASAGQAAELDFDHVRELVVAEAREADRTANGADPEAGLNSELHRALLQSIERLRAAAAAGQYPRDEYLALRAALVRRARNAIKDAAPPPASAPAADSNTELSAIEAGLSAALDHLEQRATAANATPEDFQQVREHLIARARAAARGVNAAAPAEAEAPDVVQRKLMQALDRLEAAARQGNFSREEYAQMRESMIHRARQIENPGQPRTVAASADDGGMDQAADDLSKRVDGGQVSPADFRKLRELIAGKAQIAAGNTDPISISEASVYQNLMHLLDRLEKAAQSGSVDRQEFKAFKDSFIHRARQIARNAAQANSASGPGTSAADTSGKRAAVPVATPAPTGEAGNKGADSDPKPVSQPVPPARPKPGGQEPEKPPQLPPKPPHRPAPDSGDGKPAGDSSAG